jgi:hypothetical protein
MPITSSLAIVQSSKALVTSEAFQRRWLRAVFQSLAIALGALHTWAAIASYSMSEDGISYLDMGDAYLRGDWGMAVNSVWSPLYSWALGLAMRVFEPPMRWEFALVQVVNLAIYLGALLCFGFFWRQLGHYRQVQRSEVTGERHIGLPEWAWIAFGYSLFVWSSLSLIKVWVVTPDMLMACFVYLAAGLVLRIRLGHAGWPTFAVLGMVLGLAYLAKAAMFPLSFVFLAASLFAARNWRRASAGVAVAFVVFIVLSLPFVASISTAKGRLTFGDAGTLTYVRYVNGVPYPHWQGETPGSGTPQHPSRRIWDDPPIYEFGTPIWGTYPISYDPSYWYEGVQPHVDVAQQLSLLLTSALFYFDLFLRQQGAVVVAVLMLYFLGQRRRLKAIDLIGGWVLVLVALAAFGIYALVYVEGRYIGVFVVLLWADLVANLRLPEAQPFRKLAAGFGAIMALFLLLNIVAFNLEGFADLNSKRSTAQRTSEQAGPPSWPGEVAQELHELGIQQGDKVGVIGYGFDSFWARLARVRIVAEMFGWEADPFWLGDPALQSEVVEAFASTGAEAIIAEKVPDYASLAGWHRVGNSNYYILALSP